jgi:hypothetical protein
MSWITDLLENAFPLILNTAKQIADGLIKGENLNRDQKQALYSAYVIIKVHGDELAESTANTFDDDGLRTLAEFCEDTLAEAGIDVPIIPEDLLEQ